MPPLVHGAGNVRSRFNVPWSVWENAAIFDFNMSEEEMTKLDSLNEDLRTSGWDPESDQFK